MPEQYSFTKKAQPMKKKSESPEVEVVEVETLPLLQASLGGLNNENATGNAMSREEDLFADE